MRERRVRDDEGDRCSGYERKMFSALPHRGRWSGPCTLNKRQLSNLFPLILSNLYVDSTLAEVGPALGHLALAHHHDWY